MSLVLSSIASGAGLSLLAFALVAGWLRKRRYRMAFRISARRHDLLVCRADHGNFSVSVEPDGFTLPPALAGRGQTAFLSLSVKATGPGRLRDPFIGVRHGDVAYRQYFERGVAGRRQLNLSPLFQDASGPFSRIELRGGSVGWQRDAMLSVFEPPALANAETLVLAPHPDDAEIAAFGLYARRPSWVVTITAGERGTAALPGPVSRRGEDSEWLAFLRVWDSLSIPRLGGVPEERCLNLVYPDGQLEGMHRDAARPFALACEESLSRRTLRSRNRVPELQRAEPQCTWQSLVAEIRFVLEKAKPDIVVCPHPLVDAHPDHVFTAVALEQAVRALPHRPRAFFLYVVHRRDVPLYPFGPARGLVSLPPWTEGDWIADSIYSHPLPSDLQRAKYFAVEAAHDERSYGSGESVTARGMLTNLKRELSAFVAGMAVRPGSFLRRAPRPNELYYVVSADSLAALVDRALARQEAPREQR